MRVKSGSGLLKTAGQTTVEMLLVLPVFLMMVFFILELGMYCYQVILVNHGMFEAARICSLQSGAKDATMLASLCNARASTTKDDADKVFKSMFGSDGMIQLVPGSIDVTCDSYGNDTQNNTGQYDITLEAKFNLKLFFPMTRFAFGGDSNGNLLYETSLRMPVDQPVWCLNGQCN